MGVVREDMMLAGERGGHRGQGQMGTEDGIPKGNSCKERTNSPPPPPRQKLELPPR